METRDFLHPDPAPRAPFSTWRILQTTISTAVILATLFTGLPPRLFSRELGGGTNLWMTPSAPLSSTPGTSAPLRIGIIPGHWGNDSGTVCDNGTTESQVNLAIAQIVEQKLSAHNYDVELLMENDPRLVGYKAALLVSIHNDSCEYINELATGFKVAASYYANDENLATRLTSCLTDRYGRITGLPYNADTVTVDMQYYYAFRDIDKSTTAAIIEAGFMNLDYDILTQNPDLIATGIVQGILCYTGDEGGTTDTGTSP